MDVYDRLGVRKVVNAAGTLTSLGGSLMESETIEAMNEAAKSFVYMDDLMKKAGEIIAEVTGAEAGLVTSGAAASLTLAAAACMTGKDSAKISKLPDTTGMRNEIIIQKLHRNVYDRCLRASGAKLVEVGDTSETKIREIEEAINEKTAAIIYYVFDPRPGVFPLEEVIKIGRTHGVPVIVDAAAEVPPPENLRRFIVMGADLVLFSGGKQILGPNDSGILCGRRELIEAASLNAFPHADCIGRSMKIGKEQIVGLVTALERYVKKDHDAEMNRWIKTANYIAEQLNTIPHVESHVIVPQSGPRPLCIPKAEVRFDEEALGVSTSDIVKQLREGNPAVEVTSIRDKPMIHINPQCLTDGQERIVVERLKGILKQYTDR